MPIRHAHITDDLIEDLRALSFGPPVSHVYNPLEYARAAYDCYLKRFAAAPKEVVLVGMNPGPWGMAQTGVPFGEVAAVREFLGIEAAGAKTAEMSPQTAGGRVCLPPQRGQRPAGVGLGQKDLRDAGALLRALFHRQLLPAALHGRRRAQPHAQQPARGRAQAPRGRLRPGPAAHGRASRPRLRGRHRRICRAARRIEPCAGLAVRRRPHHPPQPGQPQGQPRLGEIGHRRIECGGGPTLAPIEKQILPGAGHTFAERDHRLPEFPYRSA